MNFNDSEGWAGMNPADPRIQDYALGKAFVQAAAMMNEANRPGNGPTPTLGSLLPPAASGFMQGLGLQAMLRQKAAADKARNLLAKGAGGSNPNAATQFPAGASGLSGGTLPAEAAPFLQGGGQQARSNPLAGGGVPAGNNPLAGSGIPAVNNPLAGSDIPAASNPLAGGSVPVGSKPLPGGSVPAASTPLGANGVLSALLAGNGHLPASGRRTAGGVLSAGLGGLSLDAYPELKKLLEEQGMA